MVQPNIVFDVSSEVSLDTLAKEILPLLQTKGSRLYLDPCGPAGGNTEVSIVSKSAEDTQRVVQYVNKHGLNADVDGTSIYNDGVCHGGDGSHSVMAITR